MIAQQMLPPLKTYDRLHLQHYTLKALLGSNMLAPLESPGDILDVGCGQGLWALDVALSLPSSRVVGLDRSLLSQCSYHNPLNFLLVTGDILSGLPFADMSFDYVHQRFLSPLIPASRWQFLISELARVTRSGGWIEFVEYGSVYGNAGPSTQQFLDWWKQTATKQGLDIGLMQHLAPMLERVGIHSIEQRIIAVPLGAWGGETGCAMGHNLEMYIGSFKPWVMNVLNVRSQDVDRVLRALPEEWETFQTTYQFYAAYGQRPYAHLDMRGRRPKRESL